VRWIRSLACVLAVVAAASQAKALTLDAARVVIRSDGTDSFQVKGRRRPLDLSGAAALEFAFDRFGVHIPIDELRRKKQRVSYRNTTPGARVSRLRLDLKSGRFAVAGEDWSLLDLPNPLRVDIGTEADLDCALARLRNPAARGGVAPSKPRRATRLKLVGGPGGDGPCDVIQSMQSAPIVVTAGTPTDVEFSLRTTGTVDPASLRIRRLDAAGAIVGDPLCSPVAVADATGRFACETSITEAAAGSLTLVAEGMAGETRVSSPGFWLPVVPPLTDADEALVASAADAVPAAWEDIRASMGDTLDARLALVRRLRTAPGILRAGLSPDGIDVTFRFVTGWQGGLVLNRPEVVDAAPASATTVGVPTAARVATSTIEPLPRAVFRTCGLPDVPDAPDDEGICCQPKDRRQALLGRKVIVWNPGFFRQQFDDTIPIMDQFQALPCLGHDVEPVLGESADVASTTRFAEASTLVISTHGLVLDDDQVMILTGEPVRFPLTKEQRSELSHGLLGAGTVARPGAISRAFYAVTEKRLRSSLGRFPDRAIVYASYCYSAYHGGPLPFLEHNAGGVLAYSWAVSEDYGVTVAKQLFDGLVPQFLTVGEAYDQVTPKVDPTSREGHVPDPRNKGYLAIKKAARFTLFGERRIAYVGQPEIVPPAATVGPGQSAQLSAMAEGKGTCEMTYHWHSRGDAGDLSNADGTGDFLSVDPTVSYTADPDPEATADDVGVELLGPDAKGAVGVSCAEATVGTTVTTTSTSTSTTISAACGSGVVEAADVFEEIDVDVGANDLQGTNDQAEGYHPPDTNGTFVPPAMDSKPWNLSASAGGAQATSTGQISYTIAPCSITAQGTFHESSFGGSTVGNASTGLDARLQIGFRVSRQASYHLSGSVMASGTAKDPPATVFYARCSGSFDTTEASLQSPTGQPVPFAKDSTAFPGETLTILCSVHRGGASTDAFGDDAGDVSWTFTVTFD
jgi:hypothetical protein